MRTFVLLLALAAPVAAQTPDSLGIALPDTAAERALEGAAPPDTVANNAPDTVAAHAEAPLDPPLAALAADTLAPRPRFGLYQPEAERRFQPSRFYAGLGAVAALDAVALAALSRLWYSGERVPFHWNNTYFVDQGLPDPGWLDDWDSHVQMDKGGHVLTSYHIARMVGEYGRWSGLSDRHAGLAGFALSTVFQSQIEFFDGFAQDYGASRTDLLANLVGAGLGGLKIAAPEATRSFDLKLSYFPSTYYDQTISSIAAVRVAGNVIKDYEGLTYWLTLKPSALGAPRWWPAWLDVAAGYGGSGLAHSLSGYGTDGGPGPEHVRQFYLALDFDVLRTLRPRVPSWLRPVTTFFEIVHLPAPAVEVSSKGVTVHLLHF